MRTFARRRPRVVVVGFVACLMFLSRAVPAAPAGPAFDLQSPALRLVSEAPDAALTFVNGNGWWLPYPFSTSRHERLERVIGLVDQLQPDFVLLQEAWTHDVVERLRRVDGYRAFASGVESDLFNAGGLVTLVHHQWQGAHARFVEYPPDAAATSVEALARKGYLVVRVPVGATTLNLVNTHVYAPMGEDPAQKAVAESQVRLLARLRLDGTTVLGGDLNVPEARATPLLAPGFRARFAPGTSMDPANPYRGHGVNYWVGSSEAMNIDALALRGPDQARLDVEMLRTPLSDHYFLTGVLHLPAPAPPTRTSP